MKEHCQGRAESDRHGCHAVRGLINETSLEGRTLSAAHPEEKPGDDVNGDSSPYKIGIRTRRHLCTGSHRPAPPAAWPNSSVATIAAPDGSRTGELDRTGLERKLSRAVPKQRRCPDFLVRTAPGQPSPRVDLRIRDTFTKKKSVRRLCHSHRDGHPLVLQKRVEASLSPSPPRCGALSVATCRHGYRLSFDLVHKH